MKINDTLLNPDQTDETYAAQFKDGNALIRGIMKYCPRCKDGMCYSVKAHGYSESRQHNPRSGHCWIGKNLPCPHCYVNGVILRMIAAKEGYSFMGSRLVARNGRYVNPCFEETPKESFLVEPKKALWLYNKIMEADFFKTAPKCPCGQPRPKRCKYCAPCARRRKLEGDRLRKQKSRRKSA